jgi:hypothetical protein
MRHQMKLNAVYSARVTSGPGQVVLAVWPLADQSGLLTSISPDDAETFAETLLAAARAARSGEKIKDGINMAHTVDDQITEDQK